MLPRRTKESVLREAVVEKLVLDGWVGVDDVLIHEMVVGDYERRADIVVANGHLTAFELKSEADTLDRVTGQVEAYRRHLEKVFVVVDKKFKRTIRAAIPSSVGIWVVDNGRIKEGRKAQRRLLTKEAALSLLHVNDLKTLLRENGIAPQNRRSGLIAQATKLPISLLRDSARRAVKARYSAKQPKVAATGEPDPEIANAQACTSVSAIKAPAGTVIPRRKPK